MMIHEKNLSIHITSHAPMMLQFEWAVEFVTADAIKM